MTDRKTDPQDPGSSPAMPGKGPQPAVAHAAAHGHDAAEPHSHGLRRTLWQLLEHPEHSGGWARAVEIGLIVLIALNVLAVMLETIPEYHARYKLAFDLFETVSIVVFSVEYLARLWVAPEAHPALRAGRVRWRYLRSPMALIDLMAILPSLLAFVVPFDLRTLRVFRLLRVFKLTRYSSAMAMLLTVLQEEARSFFAGFFILFVLLVLAATGAYLAEHRAQPEDFGSIPHAMWWAMATLTTVGYGDVTPITAVGRIFGGLVTVVGVGMAALPAGILASGMNAQLHRNRDRMRQQLRVALMDGRIDPSEEAALEKLRREIGLSRAAALDIREEILLQQVPAGELCQCPHCGERFRAGPGL